MHTFANLAKALNQTAVQVENPLVENTLFAARLAR